MLTGRVCAGEQVYRVTDGIALDWESTRLITSHTYRKSGAS